ncbi:MAG: aminoacetone oxidase family FAD-binding enzyme, partial [Bacteroidales bacterium]|nr:aminoacetone oxidase family FAD-binding enzyme [Bacteroidales bacterium]
MEKIYGDVVVIGAGPAGMMAAIRAAEAGARVVLLEKNGRVGRKLMITGKGRCNLTNRKVWNDFSPHIHPKPNFFKPAFHFFTNDATVDFFESIGVETVLTRGDRVFPASMKAVTVVDGLSRCLSRHENINLMTDCTVTEVSRCEDDTMSVKFVRSSPNGGAPCSFTVESRAVVVATGGMSYPTTGSTGDGYAFAESLGHTMTRLFPSLTALTPRQYDLRLEGVELVNVALSLYVDHDILAHEFGDVQF